MIFEHGPGWLIGGHEAIGPPWGHGTTLEPWDHPVAMRSPWSHKTIHGS